MKEIARILEEVKEEDRKEKVRKQEYIAKKTQERNEKIRKEKERQEQIAKKRKCEERYELLKWVTNYIQENGQKWEQERMDRIENEKKIWADWEKKQRFAKIEKIRARIEQEKQEKIAKLDKKREKKHQNI